MVRRTKKEALETRSTLLDVAQRLFQEHGVSRTSLADIADAAGVTRGAVYWHFENKAALFNALIERVVLPIEEAAQRVDLGEIEDAIAYIRASSRRAFRTAAHDCQARAVFEIVSHKVEYVGEMSSARDRHFDGMQCCLDQVERALRVAIKRGQLPRATPARAAAFGLHALIDGMIQSWLLAPKSFDLERQGARAIDIFLVGLGADLQPNAPVCARARRASAKRS